MCFESALCLPNNSQVFLCWLCWVYEAPMLFTVHCWPVSSRRLLALLTLSVQWAILLMMNDGQLQKPWKLVEWSQTSKRMFGWAKERHREGQDELRGEQNNSWQNWGPWVDSYYGANQSHIVVSNLLTFAPVPTCSFNETVNDQPWL